MKERNEIDELFRSRLYDREFDFDEQAWKGAEQLLDQHDRKYGGYWRRGLYGLIALLFITGGTYLGVQQLNTIEQDIGAAAPYAEESRTEVEAASSPDGRQHVVREKTDVPLTYDRPVSSRTERADKNTPAGEDTESEVAPAPVERIEELIENEEEPVNERTTEQQLSLNSESDQSAAHEKNKIALAVAEQPKSALRDRKAEKISSTTPSSVVSPGTAYKSKGVRQERIREWDNSDLAAGSARDRKASNDFLVLERMEALKPQVVVEHNKQILRSNVLTGEQKDRFSSGGLTHWGVILGAGYGTGANMPADDQGAPKQIMVYKAGLRYAHYLNSRFSIQANMLYKQVTNLDVRVQLVSETFDFGYNHEFTTVRSTRVSYIEIPVYLNYYLGGRYHLYTGLQLAQLAGVWSQRSITYENDFGATTQASTKLRSYRDHFESSHFSFIGGAEYLINERIGIGVRYNKGLTPLTNDKYVRDGNDHLDDLTLIININLGK